MMEVEDTALVRMEWITTELFVARLRAPKQRWADMELLKANTPMIVASTLNPLVNTLDPVAQ